MPDGYRAGASIGVTERFRVVGEAVRRNYSRLAADDYTTMGTSHRFPYRDATEIHAGAEYRLASLPVALRAGWWHDPAHFGSDFTVLGQSLEHYTVGAGLALGAARVDLAYDGADDPVARRAVIGVTFPTSHGAASRNPM